MLIKAILLFILIGEISGFFHSRTPIKKVLGDLYDNLAHGLVAFHQKMCVNDIVPVKFFLDEQLVVVGTLCKVLINHMLSKSITQTALIFERATAKCRAFNLYKCGNINLMRTTCKCTAPSTYSKTLFQHRGNVDLFDNRAYNMIYGMSDDK